MKYPTASALRRLANWIIDLCLAWSIALMLTIVLLFTVVPEQPFSWWMVTIPLVLVFLYYFLLEWATGRTFGKYITRTQVLTTEAARPSVVQVLKRTWARVTPLNSLWYAVDGRRAVHDKASGTVVVSHKDVPPHLRPKRERAPQAIACALFLLPGVYLGWWTVDILAGGQLIEVPDAMPSDLRLVGFEDPDYEGAPYQRLTYEGNGRVIQFSRLTAGFHFDDDNQCIYTEPAPRVLLDKPIDPTLECLPLEGARSDDGYVKVVTITGEPLDPATRALVPDYILDTGVVRYAIKAVTGELTEAEVAAMANGTHDVKARKLAAIAERNAAGEPRN